MIAFGLWNTQLDNYHTEYNQYNHLGYIDYLPPFSVPFWYPFVVLLYYGEGGGGGGGGQYTLGYIVREGDSISRGGTIHPKVYCPGDNIT